MNERVEQFLKQQQLKQAVGADLRRFRCACGRNHSGRGQRDGANFRCVKCFGAPVEQ